MAAEGLDHLAEQGIRLLDLLLLGADFFFRLGDIRPVALDQGGGLVLAFPVRLDPALRGKDPVPDRLDPVPCHRRRRVEIVDPLAESRQLGLLRGDFLLVDRAGGFALADLELEVFELVGEVAVIPMREVRIECAQILHQCLVAARFPRLPLQRTDLPFDLLNDVLHADEVHLGVFQFPQGLFFLGLVFGDPGRLLEDCAPILRPAAEDEVDLPLLHDRIGAPPDAGIHEELVNVLQPADRLVQEIFALAVAVDPARDPHLVPIRPEFFFALCERHRNLRHPESRTAVGAAENDVRHLAAAQGFCRLLAEHPPDGIQHVRLAAAVRADDRGHPTMKIQNRFRRERFEPDDFQ